MSMTNEEKAALRKAMRSLPEPRERLTEGEAAARYLADWPVFLEAGTVGCYVSMGWEIDTLPVLNAILRSGKILALPRTYEKGIMEFRRVLDPAFLHPGRWNIPEPGDEAEIIHPEDMSLLLIPALAVDDRGRRLGQGAGYYDRYLTQTHCALAALVLSRQVVPAVPCGERDYLVQWIITGNGILQVIHLD
jgi:5-formyltetrahydrofolate cyclo-ligase